MYKYFIMNHVPRCGGTSLKKSIYDSISTNNYFKRYPAYISGFTHNNICLYEQPNLIQAIHPDTLLFTDHSPAFFIEEAFNIDLSDAYRAITLRHPLSRIKSHIHYFYSQHIDSLSDTVLNNYLSRFGHVTIWYLTTQKYGDKSLADRFKIARSIIRDYDFRFKVEDQSLYEFFNNTNPFELHMPNYHTNHSLVDSTLPISQRVKNLIYQHSKLEIKLLEEYYEMGF